MTLRDGTSTSADLPALAQVRGTTRMQAYLRDLGFHQDAEWWSPDAMVETLATRRVTDWDVLASIERDWGGLLSRTARQVGLGPSWIFAHERELREKGHGRVEPPDVASPAWPWIARAGVELCLVAAWDERGDHDGMVDRAGAVYLWDEEFGELSHRADSILAMFEKRALSAEVNRAWGSLTRLSIDVDDAAGLALHFGVARVVEASDGAGAEYVGPGVWVRSRAAFLGRRARTEIVARRVDDTVSAAQWLRDRWPDRRLSIRTDLSEGWQRFEALRDAGVADVCETR